MSEMEKPHADLRVRLISAAAMLAVTGWEIWMGGVMFSLFVGLITLGLLWEWWGLSRRIGATDLSRTVLMLLGIAYIGVASLSLLALRREVIDLVAVIACVIATDTGAYFAGRAIGGPKIAPSISPSKTWAGLGGGMVASAITMIAIFEWDGNYPALWWILFGILGAFLAILAQAGDFLESGMKRKAGVKDSGHLIPGHGGLLDRLDGLLAVAAVMGLLKLFTGGLGAS